MSSMFSNNNNYLIVLGLLLYDITKLLNFPRSVEKNLLKFLKSGQSYRKTTRDAVVYSVNIYCVKTNNVFLWGRGGISTESNCCGGHTPQPPTNYTHVLNSSGSSQLYFPFSVFSVLHMNLN